MLLAMYNATVEAVLADAPPRRKLGASVGVGVPPLSTAEETSERKNRQIFTDV